MSSRERALGRHRRKAQSAMEYLMTYGWAILIISVVLGTLFQLGVFNSTNFAPRAPPGSCRVFRAAGVNNLEGVCSGLIPQYTMLFNGKSSTYVQTPIMPVYTQLTLTGWVRVYKWAAGGVFYGGYINPNECGPIWGTVTGSTFGINWDACLCPGSGGCYGYAGIGSLPINQWIMFAYTSDGSGNVKGYAYTPSQTYTASTSSTAFTIQSTYWLIGQYEGPNWDSGMNGTMANMQAYSSVLSANDLQSLYAEGIGGVPITFQSLIGWWPLNGDANDYSGNNNNGVPYGVAYIPYKP